MLSNFYVIKSIKTFESLRFICCVKKLFTCLISC
ncbi:hypothetical protein OIU78_019507 [Salix suchowensis]|nr:hypothetical protein OIU78_019507 [Salix suchowensis]